MVPIKEALTFDDVTLAPKYSEILPSEVNTGVQLTKNLKLKIPLLSSAMDTVTESKMAIAIAESGGIGVIHRNLDIKNQILEIKKVKKLKLLVGAAVGAGPNEFKRAEAIIKEGVDLIVVDTAHGHTKKVGEIIKFIKKFKNKKIALCAGNIATPEAAKFLIKLGVDIIKVGIGPGSICTTRLVAGIGVPQLSAILSVRNGLRNKNVKIISDGGIKYSGDLAKAFAAGADAVMIGSLFAGTDEAPGKLIKKNEISKDLIYLVPTGSKMEEAAKKLNMKIACEIFADRNYEDDGNLVSRKKPHALITNPEEAKKHVLNMVKNQSLNCHSGKQIPCEIDSVCIHGDNESSLATAKSIKNNLIENGLKLKPLNQMKKFI